MTRAWMDGAIVFAVALFVRGIAAVGIAFPIPEDSAYYVAVARNLATGHGLVSDVLWSYATPPLAVPRPAFDLWQPLASFLAAPFMAVLGPSLAAAQLPSVLVGAAVAPLTWPLARGAAREMGVAEGRASVIAFTAGLLVALTPLLVIQSAEPDSSAPYAALVVAACALVPRALAERPGAWRSRALLGALLGLAYLARSDAVYLIVAFVIVTVFPPRGARAAGDSRLRRVAPTLLLAGLVVTPWLIRQALTWETSPLGQLVENAWSIRQTDIFAWSTRPRLAAYLAVGPVELIRLRLDAVVGNTLVVLVTAFPAGLIGLLTLLARPRLLGSAPLRPLVIVTALTFLVDILVFPVAGRSGLWTHGSGPAIVLLAILAGVGLEALHARVAAVRRWHPPSGPFSRAGLVAPLAVAIIATPLVALAATLEHERATKVAAEYAALAAASARWDLPADLPVVADRPMWVAAALGRPTLALPREAPPAIVDLMRRFGSVAVVIREDDPSAAATALSLVGYRDVVGRACFEELPAVSPFRALGFACATVTAGLAGP